MKKTYCRPELCAVRLGLNHFLLAGGSIEKMDYGEKNIFGDDDDDDDSGNAGSRGYNLW